MLRLRPTKRLGGALATAALAALLTGAARGQDAATLDASAAPGASSGTPAPEASPGPVRIDAADVESIRVDADHFEAYEDPSGARMVRATGHVHVVVVQAPPAPAPGQPPKPPQLPQTADIVADEVLANMDTKVLTARGNVALLAGGHTVTGQDLEYRWESQTGRVANVTFQQYGITFHAEEMELSAARQLVRGVEFSTCGLDNPDFKVSADEVVIVPNRRIQARHVRIDLFRRRIITLPRLDYRLRKGKAQSRRALPVARPGYSEVSGLSLIQPVPLGPNLDSEVELATRAGLRGRLMYSEDGAVTPYAEIALRQEESVRGRRPVLVSRLPEAGLRFGPNREGTLSLGYYKEHETGTRKGRIDLSISHALLDRGARPGLSLRVMGRISGYSNDDVYRTVGLEASVGRGGEDVFEEVGARVNGVEGRTPFLWDEVQLKTEIFGAKRIAWGSYRLEGDARWDVTRSEFYDLQVAVARRYRCVEPEIRYSTRRQFITVGIKLFGIGTEEAPAIPPVTPRSAAAE